MDIDYRTLDPRSTKDLCQWLALYERSFNKPASENAWRWKYAESPFGNGEKHQIYIANSGNSIIGSLSLMPMQLYLQSYGEKEIIPSGLVTNVMVHPDFRNRGIFSTLLGHAMDAAAEMGLEFLYGYAVNPYSLRGFLRRNWREVQGFKSYSLYLYQRQTLRQSLIGGHCPDTIKSLINFIPEEPYIVRHQQRKCHQYQFSCGDVEDFFADIERTHSNYIATNRISGVRDIQSLKWLFGYPGMRYYCFGMWEGEELVAYIIIRQLGSDIREIDKSAIIEDSFARNGNISLDRRLLSYTAKKLRQNQFTKISTYLFRQGINGLFPVFNGFIYRPDNLRFIYRVLNGERISSHILNKMHWDLQLAERTPL